MQTRSCYQLTLVLIVLILSSLGPTITFAQTKSAPAETMDEKERLAKMRELNRRMHPPLEIDDDRVTAMGIRKLTGQYITMYTDIRDNKDIDDFCNVFDQAMPQWCKIFDISEESVAPLKMTVIVMLEEERFEKAGLKPRNLPKFLAGFNRGHEIWVKNQPGDYYTRHLLLHEGTHAFMQWMLGGSGPPWYSEGMAEMIALHQYTPEIKAGVATGNHIVKINHRIKDKSEADYWGRIKIINEDFRDKRAMTLDNVMSIGPGSFFETRPRHYAWSWAACDFFANHPLTKESFADLGHQAADITRRFNNRFTDEIEEHRATIDRDWRTFVAEAEYGYAPERAAISTAKADPESDDQTKRYLVATNRGWQRTGLTIRKGDTLTISGEGEYEVNASMVNGKRIPWKTQSGGVTIDYYRGQPLGILMAAVLKDDGLTPATPVGSKSTLKFPSDGELCLRINESPAKLEDNVGTLKVTVKK